MRAGPDGGEVVIFFAIVHFVASLAGVVWQVCYMVRGVSRVTGRREPRWANRIFFECRPFAPAIFVTAFLAGSMLGTTAGWRYSALMFGLLNWLLSRSEHDDDDRWKRRRKAAAERVARVGARLSVVPVRGGA